MTLSVAYTNWSPWLQTTEMTNSRNKGIHEVVRKAEEAVSKYGQQPG